ncbi:MAG: hypothetical protein WCJ15_11765 [Alphaproteobacteria bacterium]
MKKQLEDAGAKVELK